MVALTARRSASTLHQLGVGRCFIDKHQPVGVLAKERHTPIDPEVTSLSDIKLKSQPKFLRNHPDNHNTDEQS
jgi:hypothetical protein